MVVRAIGLCSVRETHSLRRSARASFLDLVLGSLGGGGGGGGGQLGGGLEAVLGEELVDPLDGLRDAVLLERDRERDRVLVVEDLEHGLGAGHKVDGQVGKEAARLGVVADDGASPAALDPALEYWKFVQASSRALRTSTRWGRGGGEGSEARAGRRERTRHVGRAQAGEAVRAGGSDVWRAERAVGCVELLRWSVPS